MPTHVIISTHTTRHLRLTLLGVAIQRPAAASVTVSIDNQDPAVAALARECSHELKLDLFIVSRAWPEEVRVGQVRNNGVRGLLANRTELAVSDSDLLYFLDGDSVAPLGLLSRAAELSSRAELLVGGRICLTQAQTEAFSESALRAGEPPVALNAEQVRERDARHRRYLWQARFKPFGLVKAHKPKILGASHGVKLSSFVRVNGYDESFLGAWREDDDFGRRVYLAGGRCAVGVRDLCVYHLWHPLNPKKRENWSELDAARPNQKGAASSPGFAPQGLVSPRPQAEILIEQVRKGRTTSESRLQASPPSTSTTPTAASPAQPARR